MKKLVLGLLVLFAVPAFAETEAIIFPQVYNFGNMVQVQVWNNSNDNVTCSGFVYMNLQSGRRDSQYYYEMVWARGSRITSIRPINFNDRIMSVSHSIFCH